MKTKVYRHGEILLVPIEKIPKGLKVSKSKIIMQGSHSNSHTISQGKLYFREDEGFVFGYLEAKGTNLLHPEHSPKIGEAKLPDGFYKLIKQQEHTPEGLIPVVD